MVRNAPGRLVVKELVLVRVDAGVAIVTINNPSVRNALSLDVLKALKIELENVADQDGVRALILTGSGEHFCAGGDISGMTHERSVRESRARIPIHAAIVRQLVGGAIPVIAAVEGWAAGAGLSLVAAADYVVASSASSFSAAFGKMGLLPDLGLLWTLPQRVGLAQAKRLLFTGRKLDANGAFTLGLVDHLCEPGQALSTSLELAEEYRESAPLATAVIKSCYAQGVENLEDAIRCELDNQPSLFQTKDHREAVNAFLEKRKPIFQNT